MHLKPVGHHRISSLVELGSPTAITSQVNGSKGGNGKERHGERKALDTETVAKQSGNPQVPPGKSSMKLGDLTHGHVGYLTVAWLDTLVLSPIPGPQKSDRAGHVAGKVPFFLM